MELGQHSLMLAKLVLLIEQQKGSCWALKREKEMQLVVGWSLVEKVWMGLQREQKLVLV